jgi:N-acetyl-1-D-myo-inositol-2-amino-2-deoxy-alpha-D-glucopyranoside deacetylase
VTKTLLAVYAHPDDEAFGSGATLAYYAGNGTQVALVCATNGDVGEIADPSLATPESLGRVRQDELRCAAGSLGVHDLTFLDYRDSGMAGTLENADPRAFVNAPAEEVVERLVGIIRRLRPQVVVTFDPDGVYGHPDHIAVHRHTVSAFHAAGDPERYAERGQPWQPDRLFYAVTPRTYWHQMLEHMKAAGEDVSQWERDAESEWGWPDDQVDVIMSLPDTVDAKLMALSCHATQFGPDNLFRRLPEETMRELLSQEYFALAWPGDRSRLSDLFDGLPQ